MQNNKKEQVKIKSKLHPRNKHRYSYDFEQLIIVLPELAKYVYLNKYNNQSIDFFNPDAVKILNKALLKYFYNINEWNIPNDYLIPPIPGRADYIHYISDLLASKNNGSIPTGKKIKCLDIGVGANCIYPIIGNKEYGWSFIGSDIDLISIESAKNNINKNNLSEAIELRHQDNIHKMFGGILKKDEIIDLTICNPPFHNSLDEAKKASLRKYSNLKKKKYSQAVLNFAGQSNELWCKGGEFAFVKKMIKESKIFSKSCFVFSTLISKKENLNKFYKLLKKNDAFEINIIKMEQGNKISHILAWTFLDIEEQRKYVSEKWV